MHACINDLYVNAIMNFASSQCDINVIIHIIMFVCSNKTFSIAFGISYFVPDEMLCPCFVTLYLPSLLYGRSEVRIPVE